MLKRIFEGDYLKRLDNIIQWQEVDVIKHESVSQHSYKVLVFATIALEDIFGNSDNVEVLKYKLDVIRQSALHDWDECLLRRDISHETKYNDFNGNALRSELDRLSGHLANKHFTEKKHIGDVSEFPEITSASKMLKDYIQNPVCGVKKFVKWCDWLAVEFYVVREIALGNDDFLNRIEYVHNSQFEAKAELIEVLASKFPAEMLNFEKIMEF